MAFDSPGSWPIPWLTVRTAVDEVAGGKVPVVNADARHAAELTRGFLTPGGTKGLKRS